MSVGHVGNAGWATQVGHALRSVSARNAGAGLSRHGYNGGVPSTPDIKLFENGEDGNDGWGGVAPLGAGAGAGAASNAGSSSGGGARPPQGESSEAAALRLELARAQEIIQMQQGQVARLLSGLNRHVGACGGASGGSGDGGGVAGATGQGAAVSDSGSTLGPGERPPSPQGNVGAAAAARGHATVARLLAERSTAEQQQTYHYHHPQQQQQQHHHHHHHHPDFHEEWQKTESYPPPTVQGPESRSDAAAEPAAAAASSAPSAASAWAAASAPFAIAAAATAAGSSSSSRNAPSASAAVALTDPAAADDGDSEGASDDRGDCAEFHSFLGDEDEGEGGEVEDVDNVGASPPRRSPRSPTTRTAAGLGAGFGARLLASRRGGHQGQLTGRLPSSTAPRVPDDHAAAATAAADTRAAARAETGAEDLTVAAGAVEPSVECVACVARRTRSWAGTPHMIPGVVAGQHYEVLRWRAHRDTQGRWFARIRSSGGGSGDGSGGGSGGGSGDGVGVAPWTGLAPHKYLDEVDPLQGTAESDSN